MDHPRAPTGPAVRNQQWTIGDTVLTAIVEAETSVPTGFLLPDATTDHVLSNASESNRRLVSIDGSHIGFRVQAFLLEVRDRVVLVDPCVGNHKRLSVGMWNDLDTSWLDRLAATGHGPTDIDLVVHTHLHEDHIGWDTHLVDGEWVPTFTNARHVYVGDELDYAEREDRRPADDPFAESVEPVLQAGLATEVSGTTDLEEGVTLVSTPGHTPGHASLRVTTGAEPLFISGDLIDHPLQCGHPSLAHGSDWDRDRARSARSSFLDEVATTGAVMAGTHFPAEPVGLVERERGAWRFLPIAAS